MESTRTDLERRADGRIRERTEENFKEVRREIRGVRTELKDEIRDLRFATTEAKIERRFDVLFGAMATGFVAASSSISSAEGGGIPAGRRPG